MSLRSRLPAFAAASLLAAAAVPAAAAPAAQHYRMGTAPSGGTSGIIGGAIADIIQRAVPGIQVTPVASQGSAENVIRTSRGEFHFGVAANDAAYLGYHGAKGFPGKMQDFRLVAGGNRLYAHLMVPGDSPVKDWPDLKGKRIAAAAPTSPNFVALSAVLEQYGIQTSDYQPQWINSGQYADAIRNGTIDGAMLAAGYPSPAPQELCATRVGLRLLAVPPEIASKASAVRPFIEAGTIPAGAYPCVETAVPTIFTTNWLIVHKDVPADTVYAVVKRLLEEQELAAVHAAGKEWRLETALSGRAGLPLHPGAERYFREKGMLQ